MISLNKELFFSIGSLSFITNYSFCSELLTVAYVFFMIEDILLSS